ncbi:hypothetical protein ACKWTF_007180 [Chironomus riparius]
MTIILFLIDTSASMCQEAYVNGVHKSYLDTAKGAVETFLKYRQRSQDCMGDRYMLLTFEDPPNNIKAGWKENHATFMNELKNLQSNGLTTVGEALKGAFDLLNLNRMQSGIDTYGQGRCPFYLEPSIIILITDGGRYSHRNGIDSQLSLPLNVNIPGAKLTKEPFRWDQRLFSLVLRMSGHRGDERTEGKVPHDDSPLEKMCEVTGGRSYKIRSQYVLNQCIESLVQKAQPGVVINFDPVFKEQQKDLKETDLPEMIFQNMKKMIFVPKIPNIKSFPLGYWPLPESYWPDVKMTSLPPRDAHPRIKISLISQDEPQIVRNFPIDKYEMEGSPLTLWILSKKDPNKVYPIVVVNSNGGNMHDPMAPYRMHPQMTNEAPFGYLKANSTLMVVHFYVLPYNYQFLLPLLWELVHKLNLNPTSEWINKFASYVKNIPQYYCPFLRKALAMINIPYQLLQYILPESLDSYLSPTVANQLKQMKNMAKQEQENLCMRVFKQLKQPRMPYHQHETVKLNCGQPIKTAELVKHPMLRDTFQKIHGEISIFDNFNIIVPTLTSVQSTKNYRNPFDIPRRDLIDEIARMRDNFFRVSSSNLILLSKDAGNSLPIAEMGNYQEYLKRRETPLRELEPTNVRQHMFGNPYKRDKNMVMVDEADDGIDPNNGASNNKMQNITKKDIRMSRKRKAGPIRKDYIYKRARYDFGYSLPPGLPCGPSPTPSEIDDTSDTASEISYSIDDEDTRSEFSDVTSDDEFRKNGHIPDYNFDSILNDSSPDTMLNTPSPHLQLPHLIQQYPTVPVRQPSAGLSRLNLQQLDLHAPPAPHFQQSYPSHHFHQPQIGSVPVVPHIMPNNGDLSSNSLQNPAVGSAVTSQPVPTSPTTPAPPFPSISVSLNVTPIPIARTIHNNDLNDAQNISKILQSSIHNGTSSSITANHTNINNNNNNSNNNNNNDSKRLFLDEGSSQVNHKEERPNNDKNHHRSKRKAAQPKVVEKPEPPKTPKKHTEKQQQQPQQHIHTNGLIDKKPNHTIMNGNNDDTVDDELLDKIKDDNMETRSLVFREIRKLGRDYSGLYEQLGKIKGSFDMRLNFIKMCIEEASRFRRKHMADCIQEWWVSRCDGTIAEQTGKKQKKT